MEFSDAKKHISENHARLTALLAIIIAGGLAHSPNTVAAQDSFPTRPIEIVVPFSAGGTSDVSMRIVSQKVINSAGWAVIVENNGGAAGQTGAALVKRADPDGYTLFQANVATHAINAAVYQKLIYDPVADFEQIILLWQYPTALLVPGSSPIKSVADLVNLARSANDAPTYGVQGTATRMLVELLLQSEREKAPNLPLHATAVPYRGVAEVMSDLVAGQFTFTFAGFTGVPDLIKDGKLRAIAIAGDKRAFQLPQVPTMGELRLRRFAKHLVWTSGAGRHAAYY